MTQERINALQMELYEKYQELCKLRADNAPVEVKNYSFKTLEGETTLRDLFGDKDTLFLIHNMGDGCRYCTIWADGLNPFLSHLEDKFAVAMVSKNSPEDQRRMANDRGWRFRMASHGGGEYIKEQTVAGDPENPASGNYPGMVCYVREGDKILKKNWTAFGPGDEFCSLWNVLSLAGIGEDKWTPQFGYWKRPNQMDDGGQNIQD